MRMRFWCESTRDTKNACDTVVAHFLLFPPDELPRAFHTKARSHFPITALALVFWSLLGTDYRVSKIDSERLHNDPQRSSATPDSLPDSRHSELARQADTINRRIAAIAVGLRWRSTLCNPTPGSFETLDRPNGALMSLVVLKLGVNATSCDVESSAQSKVMFEDAKISGCYVSRNQP